MIILGVRVDAMTKDEFRERVMAMIHTPRSQAIFTPNPEMLVDATNDVYFRDVLNGGAINICDGKGIELVAGGELKRLPGIDAMIAVCAVAAEHGKSVYLLGSGDDAVVYKTKMALIRQFPSLRVVGVHAGISIRNTKVAKPEGDRVMIIYNREDNDQLVDSIIDTAPEILLVAFGHGKQEKWIDENLRHLPSVRVAMGVGGAFDMIAGRVRRAPRLLRQLGVEWLWRLLIQPWRIRRIWKAVITFPYLYYRYGKDTFRA